jgi:hypothetical protein
MNHCRRCADEDKGQSVVKWCTACNWSGDYPMKCNLCELGESLPVPPTELDIKQWPRWQDMNK